MEPPQQAQAQSQSQSLQQQHQYRPSLRLCEVVRPPKGSCGFHLSRTQWDPYPWVSGVDGGSAADAAGLLPGDCVLEVNGEDVLGERIGAVAARVRARPDKVSLLLWNAGSDPHVANSVCSAGGLGGGGPTPLSLQRLSSALQAALQLLECPVCLESAAPRAAQCHNGHLLCAGCRARTDRCPVCRAALGPRGRCLLADQLHALLAAACKPSHPHPRAAQRLQQPQQQQQALQPAPPAQQPQLARRGPNRQPLVQLKSRLLLPPKSSSVEDINSGQPSGGASVGDGSSGSGSEGDEAVAGAGAGAGAGAALRARSHSTSQLPDPSAASATAEPPKEQQEALVHCPRGPSCTAGRVPASRLTTHLREYHDGPLVQYYLGVTGEVTVRTPSPSAAETIALATAAGGTLFVCSAATSQGRFLWLWALEDPRQDLTLPDGVSMPVFPLTTSWSDVISSDRCLRVDEASLEIHLSLADKQSTVSAVDETLVSPAVASVPNATFAVATAGTRPITAIG